MLTATLTALVTVTGGAAAAALATSARGQPAAPTPVIAADAADEQARALFREAGPAVEGAFVLIDVKTGGSTIINPKLAATPFTPVSTYKVIIAAAALEAGVLANQGTTMKWNGRVLDSDNPAWHRDLDLQQAMKTSSNWYFEEVNRRVGPARVRELAERLEFGTPAASADEVFGDWIDGGLTISPQQEAEFYARFAARRLPLKRHTQEVLRRILTLHENEQGGITLRAKTGTATFADGRVLGWLVGTVERLDRSFAFATLFRGGFADRQAIAERRQAITRRLLARFGALPSDLAP